MKFDASFSPVIDNPSMMNLHWTNKPRKHKSPIQLFYCTSRTQCPEKIPLFSSVTNTHTYTPQCSQQDLIPFTWAMHYICDTHRCNVTKRVYASKHVNDSSTTDAQRRRRLTTKGEFVLMGQPRMRVMCAMRKKWRFRRGQWRGVCESMNVCMCVLAGGICAPLPLIHSQQHSSEPSFPHSYASEKTGPPCWLWSALTGARLHRSSAALSAAHHVQRYWHPPAFSVSLPPSLPLSLLSSGAAPAAACSLFRGSKKSSRRSKNSSAPALPRLGAACLPQHLNTNKIPHHHHNHHDDQAAAASSALHLNPPVASTSTASWEEKKNSQKMWSDEQWKKNRVITKPYLLMLVKNRWFRLRGLHEEARVRGWAAHNKKGKAQIFMNMEIQISINSLIIPSRDEGVQISKISGSSV